MQLAFYKTGISFFIPARNPQNLYKQLALLQYWNIIFYPSMTPTKSVKVTCLSIKLETYFLSQQDIHKTYTSNLPYYYTGISFFTPERHPQNL
jgi:hypothetical protein